VGGLVMTPLKIVILPMVYEWIEDRAERRSLIAFGATSADLVE